MRSAHQTCPLLPIVGLEVRKKQAIEPNAKGGPLQVPRRQVAHVRALKTELQKAPKGEIGTGIINTRDHKGGQA